MTRDEAMQRAEAIRDEIFLSYSYGGTLEEGGSFRLPKHGDWVRWIARAILDAAHPDEITAPPSLQSLAQRVLQDARALEQAIVNQEIYRALTTELQADVTRPPVLEALEALDSEIAAERKEIDALQETRLHYQQAFEEKLCLLEHRLGGGA